MDNEKHAYNVNKYKKMSALAVVEKTLYLYEKSARVLLAIDISSNPKLLLKENFIENVDTPSIHNTTKRILNAAGFSIKSLKIYLSYGTTYYTYLTIKKEKNIYDINIQLDDALNLIDIYKTPVYVSEDIIQSEGIRITKELLKAYI